MFNENPKVTALAPWFGSKRTLAPRIVAELGEHRAYWEPFCGSMAVLMQKPAASMETVNDLHGDLVNLARIIRDPFDGPRLYRRLRRTIFHDGLTREAQEHLAGETDPFDRAYWYFIDSWCGRHGCSGRNSYNNVFCIRFTANGGNSAARFRLAIASIPAWRKRLERVVILRKDAFYLMERIEDSPHCVIYADPPYVHKGAKYVHDFEPEHHRQLADLLRRFQHTRVIVSYYDCPEVRELYEGWTFVDCTSGAVKAPEVLIINGPSFTASSFLQELPHA